MVHGVRPPQRDLSPRLRTALVAGPTSWQSPARSRAARGLVGCMALLGGHGWLHSRGLHRSDEGHDEPVLYITRSGNIEQWSRSGEQPTIGDEI